MLIHGSPSPLSYFGPLVKALSPHFRLLVPELPGYGKTPRSPTPLSLQTTAGLLESVILQRQNQPVTLVGYSGGGYHALHVAVRGNVPVRGVYVLSGFASLPEDVRSFQQQAASALRANVPGLREAFANGAVGATTKIGNPGILDLLSTWLDAPAPGVLADELDAFSRSPSLLERVAGLKCPVVLRTGTLDANVPAACSQAVATVLPGARVETVKDAAHVLLLEDELHTVQSVVQAVVGWNS